MSSKAYFEPLIGTVNGFNRVFQTRLPFQPGSILPVVEIPRGHGQWHELSANTIELTEAPLPGDIPFAWYRPK